MRSSYKRIGDYIQLVDECNRDLSITTLLGLSIDKVFIPSVANTIGSDMANYKIIRKGQFACSLMQVRRDKKIPVAMLKDHDEAIISQAYPVFEVRNKEDILPEYSMMWMSRSEFDREACFYAVGGVRGSLEWEDFCDMELPVPSIEKQKEIVAEYNTIVDRIKLNEQLNQKLEETAQAIYKQWFVDFEFPISKEYATKIGKPELEGKPYKSSGGEMVWNDELDQEIPEGWESSNMTGIAKTITCGKTPSTLDKSNFGNDIPFVTIPDLHNNVFIHKTLRRLSNKGAKSQKNKMLPENAICVSCIASPGLVAITTTQSQTNQQINTVVCNDTVSVYFAYFALVDLGVKIKEWGIKGSVGSNINKTEFSEMVLLKPAEDISTKFQQLVSRVFAEIKLLQQQLYLLFDLHNILLSKITKAD
ncbi:MAG: restriction endonuclease subunit S [Candidatus Latescibacterota bacterium]